MGFRVNTNLASLRLRRSLTERDGRLQNNFARLGSGRRTASAKDDAAGLAISERMRSELRSLSQTVRNSQSGIDHAQNADGRLNEVSDNLGRLSELAVQASNGTLSETDREAIDREFQELSAEIDSVAEANSVTGALALDGSEALTIQSGTGAGETISSPTVDIRTSSLGIDGLDLTSAASASDALGKIHEAVDSVSSVRGEIGSFSRELANRQASAVRSRESLSESVARISSLDVALESAALISNRLVSESGIATLVQANSNPRQALRLLE